MKKNLLSIIALVCAVAALAVSVYTSVSVSNLLKTQNEKIDQLLVSPAEPAPTESGEITFSSMTLEPRVWDDGDGADVVFLAVPDTNTDGISVCLDVRLNDEDVGRYPCSWNGTAYTATASLEAQNGYSYTCVVTRNADGAATQYPLASPDNPTNYQAVNLRDSLSTYCNLLVGGWEADGDALNITTLHLELQLPQLSPDGAAVACQEARLVLYHGDAEADGQLLTLVPGEGTNALTLEEALPPFTLPELADGDQLALWLEVTLSDGRTERVCGAEWYQENGELLLVAG